MNVPTDEIGFRKRTTFPEPYPSVAFEPQTSPPTEAEIQILEKYDEVSSDPVENIAGLLIRTAVNIARYQRSMEADPERYTRLSHSAKFMAQTRLVMAVTAEEGKIVPVKAIEQAVEAISWKDIPTVPRPTVISTLPYAGTEPPATVIFQPQPTEFWRNLPA